MTWGEKYARAENLIEQINKLKYGINSSKYGVTDCNIALDLRRDTWEGDGDAPQPTPKELREIYAECKCNEDKAQKIEELKEDYYNITGVYPYYNSAFDWYERSNHEDIKED